MRSIGPTHFSWQADSYIVNAYSSAGKRADLLSGHFRTLAAARTHIKALRSRGLLKGCKTDMYRLKGYGPDAAVAQALVESYQLTVKGMTVIEEGRR